MSSQGHRERYITKLLIAFASIIGAIIIIFYRIFEIPRENDWYFWAIVAAFLFCGGIYFALEAFVHKIKSDFSRRQKQRDAQRSKIID